MTRSLSILLCIACLSGVRGQTIGSNGPLALTFARAVSVPLNGVQLFDQAMTAYTWTFGKEPGAMILRSDRDLGVIEASARVNFRSEQLSMREESMGVIKYRILITIKAGECTVSITDLVHTGNHSTRRGGIDMGLITTMNEPLGSVPGMAHSNLIKLYADTKAQSSARIRQTLQSFCSRIRATADQ